mgnify:FL=1
MASSYTTNFGIEEMADGDQTGDWGTTTNFNFDILDRITAYKAVALSDASTATLTVREASPGSGTENLQNGMFRVIQFTGSLSQNCTITIAPNTTTAFFVFIDGTSGGFSLIFSQGSGANYTLVSGTRALVYCDGAGSGAAVAPALVEPLTTRGDIVVRNASNLTARLAVGSASNVVLTDGTDVSWGQVSLTAGVTGTLPVANGGTGATSLTDGGVLLGSGTSAVTAMSVLADSEMIVGDGSTDPVAESGATLRTSIGVGTGDSPQFTAVNVGAATDTTLARSGAGDLTVEGNAIYRAGGTDVPVADGGTGASSLTDGGVLLGSGTGAITAMSVLSDSEMIVGDGSGDPVAESGATLRTSIGVGTGDSPQFTAVNIGAATDTTLARSGAGDLTIEGNAIYRAGGTDVAIADGGTGSSSTTYCSLTANVSGTLPVANGGTGATSLTDGGVLLGSGTGAVTALAVLGDSEMIVGDGSTDPVAESGATLRTSIGVGTGDSPQFTAVNIGAATDTTLARSGAGDLTVEGNAIYRAGGTDVPVADGGTGASTLTDGGVLLGSGTGAVTAMSVLADSEMIVGNGSTDPVAESGATLRTSIGVGTGDSPQFTAVNIGAASDTTLARSGAGDLTVEGNAIYRAGGTDVPVADGGTGASSFTANYVLLGNGTSAFQVIAPGSDGQVLTSTGSTWQSEAAGGGADAASQAEQETGSATDVYVSPGRQQYHDSACKVWINFNGSGTISARASYNVASITDNGTGDYTVTIATDFSSANYAVSINGGVVGVISCVTRQTTIAAGSYRFETTELGNVADSTYVYFLAFGDQ